MVNTNIYLQGSETNRPSGVKIWNNEGSFVAISHLFNSLRNSSRRMVHNDILANDDRIAREEASVFGRDLQYQP